MRLPHLLLDTGSIHFNRMTCINNKQLRYLCRRRLMLGYMHVCFTSVYQRYALLAFIFIFAKVFVHAFQMSGHGNESLLNVAGTQLLGRFPSMPYNRLNRTGVTYSYLSRQARLESTNCARI